MLYFLHKNAIDTKEDVCKNLPLYLHFNTTVSQFWFILFQSFPYSTYNNSYNKHTLYLTFYELVRKTMTNLDSVLKDRETTPPTKVHIVKLWIFQ